MLTRRGVLWGGGGWLVATGLVGCGSAPRAPIEAGQPRLPTVSEPEAAAPPHAQAVTLHALGLVGTPYRYGGNTPETGFDCSGLIGYVYWHAAGMKAPRTVAAITSWGQPVAREQLRTGDLVVFASKGTPNHAGIYVGEGRFVHAPSTGGTVRLDHLASRYWAAQQLGVRRPV